MADKLKVRGVRNLLKRQSSRAPAEDLSELKFLEAALAQIRTVVAQIVPAAAVTGRIKTVDSTVAKARRIDVSESEIHDKVGVRVVVPDAEHCFAVVRKLHSTLDAVMTGYDDYINHPKKNGYRALHTTLRGINDRILEVQVRSQEMHACAETGSAQHRLYKAEQQK